ncbi:MAG: DUF4224 domain-containing protein [Betaproteobacteria bacterium]|nr:MAG: DUF4224 domain-containing protein [Betaproteobacteria bacterium]
MARAPSSPSTSIVLTPIDLEQITRRDRPTAQARILRLLGIPFVLHPTDGNLIVSRAAAEAVLGAPIGAAPVQSQGYEVNVDGIRTQGQTTAAQ